MIRHNKLTISSMLLLLSSASSFAGDKDGLTTTLEDKCIDGELWSVTVFWFWGHRLFDTQNFDKKEKCCSSGGGGHIVAAPRASGNTCDVGSNAPNGSPAANANSAASVSSGDQSGSGSQPSGPAPRSAVLGTQGPRAAAGSAFPRTVPFRQFPFPTLFTGASLPTISPQCNSQLNPSMLVVDHLGARVTRLNICTGAPVATIPVQTHPLQVRVTPDGSQAIVTSFDNAISFIDTATNTVTQRILTNGDTFPSGLAIAPDGKFALVTNYNNVAAALVVVDIAAKSITGTIPLDQVFPQSVFLNPDATLAWVTYPWVNSVEVIDVMTGAATYAFSVTNPYDVLFNATGTVAYIASGSGTVLVVDTQTYRVTATVQAGGGACDLMLSHDGRLLTVNNYLANSITVIDTVTLTSTTYPEMGAPRGSVDAPLQ